jgi:hypothetical protein
MGLHGCVCRDSFTFTSKQRQNGAYYTLLKALAFMTSKMFSVYVSEFELFKFYSLLKCSQETVNI